ncbi:hypothetical protein ACNKHM_16175 [Shigella sonnei]
MHHGTPEQAQMIRTAIEQGNGRHLLEPVLEAMNACGSLEWTRQRAEEEADKAIAALQVLPDTPWREHSSASRTSLSTQWLIPSPSRAVRGIIPVIP